MDVGYSMSMLGLAIGIVVVMCIYFKIHAFWSLMTACLFLALTQGMSLPKIVSSFETGLGGTLGFLAPILALGAILGKLMEISGGAERLARTLINFLGQSKAHWAMLIVGYICGIPVFFQVGIILLIALMFSVIREAKMPVIQVALPMIIGLLTVHCIVPPHPAAMAIAGSLNADVGKVIFYGLIVGVPAAALAGPIYGKFIAKKFDVQISGAYADAKPRQDSELPPFGRTLFVILLPLLLMINKTIFELMIDKANPPDYMVYVNFIGTPMIALFISSAVGYVLLGLNRGFSWDQLGKASESAMAPMASILLVIGAAGSFNKIIIDSGTGAALEVVMKQIEVSPLIMAWLIALIMRFALGSATVAMMAAAGFILPVLGMHPDLDPALVAIAIGAGAIGGSHVTDSGFWFVKESVGIPMGAMYATYTVATCIASVVGLLGTLVLAMFV
ncbi:gluconate:H+ symporter [Microvirga sp. W0021]|uniref:Gluconate:H+ symporter n=1 Tax=Hohaiivirga grylli TaxID=3133970 RepID=A0ABV0BN35_9HYPH